MTIDILDGQTTSVVDPGMDVNVAAGVTSTITSGDNIAFLDQLSDGATVTNDGILINLDESDEDVVVFIDNSENDITVINNGTFEGVNGVIFAEGDQVVIENNGIILNTGVADEGAVYFDREADGLPQTLINTGTITNSGGGAAVGFDAQLGQDPSGGTVNDESGTATFILNNSGTIENTDTVDSDSDAINLNGDPGTQNGFSRGSLEITAAGTTQINGQINLMTRYF